MRTRNLLITLLAVSLLFAGVVSYYASSSPDGLEKVSEDQGISQQAREHTMSDSPLADYGVKGVDNPRLSTGLAGVIGVGVTFVAASALILVVRRRKPTDADAPADAPADVQ
ncbi:PDGLE domain-containing protein [Kineosporia sp. J2-2]|uniref:PDGLE domain-containing protein n=1 Tax=Kineosporia corallincola TaxID=2835133 RepID=A0ABS5TM72_9ACTN|nr:PDGLE domain-containing protein [Kineosporia corallincola]MBT0772205.1 PDGLE domain-containing protein [Kineosporia corallincola]